MIHFIFNLLFIAERVIEVIRCYSMNVSKFNAVFG